MAQGARILAALRPIFFYLRAQAMLAALRPISICICIFFSGQAGRCVS